MLALIRDMSEPVSRIDEVHMREHVSMNNKAFWISVGTVLLLTTLVACAGADSEAPRSAAGPCPSRHGNVGSSDGEPGARAAPEEPKAAVAAAPAAPPIPAPMAAPTAKPQAAEPRYGYEGRYQRGRRLRAAPSTSIGRPVRSRLTSPAPVEASWVWNMSHRAPAHLRHRQPRTQRLQPDHLPRGQRLPARRHHRESH